MLDLTVRGAREKLRQRHGITGEPSMAGGDCAGILGRHLRNGEHQEAEKLTARLLEVVAASGRAPKRVVDGGGNVDALGHGGAPGDVGNEVQGAGGGVRRR